MTKGEKAIVKSLVAVAWADGQLAEPEAGMIDSLLWAFGATEEEEAEVREFAKKKRTIKGDVLAKALGPDDRVVLLSHAALLTHADGEQSEAEAELLASLFDHLEVGEAERQEIIAHAAERAKRPS
jgi:uncharacterized tellurite resistance protein B-like protein